MAKAAGSTVAIDHDQAKLTHDQIGSDLVGWINFQPLYDQIVHSDAGMFD